MGGLFMRERMGAEQVRADRPGYGSGPSRLNGGPSGGPSAGQVRTVLGEKHAL